MEDSLKYKNGVFTVNGETPLSQSAITEISNAVETVSGNVASVSANTNQFETIENPEYLEVKIDNDGKVIEGITTDGIKHIYNDVELNNAKAESVSVNTLTLSDEGLTEFEQALKDHGFRPGGTGDWSEYITNDGKNPLCIPEPRCAKLNIISDFDLTKLSKAGRAEAQEGFNYNIPTQVEFWDMQGNYFKKWTLMSGQGSSSMSFPKKSLAFDFFDSTIEKGDAFSIKIGNWVPQDSFHLKAYYTDPFKGIGVMTYKIWDEVLRSRGVFNDYPWKKILIDQTKITATSNGVNSAATVDDNDTNIIQIDNNAMCHPDGFPIIVYQNGNFHGIFTWQLKKHRDNYHMDKNIAENIHIDGCMYEFLWQWNGNLDWEVLTGKKPDYFGTYSFPEWRNPKTLYCTTTKEVSGKAYQDITGTDEATSILESGNYTEVIEKPSDWADTDITEKFGDNPPAYCYRTNKSKMYKLVELSGYEYTKYDADYNHEELIDDTMPYYDPNNKDHVRTNQVKKYLINLSKIQPTIESAVTVYESDKTEENLQQIKALFDLYFDVDNLIDYWITSDWTYNYDGFRGNWQWLTWDGKKWFIGMYDVDQTFGGWYDVTQTFAGPSKKHVNYERNQKLIFPILEKYYKAEIDARWKELRDCGIFSTEHIVNMTKNWIQRWGSLEVYKKECTKWPFFIKNDSILRLYKWSEEQLANLDAIYNYNK